MKVYIVIETNGVRDVELKRAAKTNKNAVKLSEIQIRKLMSLGCMRIWSLKKKLFEISVKNRNERTA